MDLCEIKNLDVKVENKLVVSKFSLKIKPGEVVAIMGPNGSGKSSLVAALAGHPDYQVVGGSARLHGKNLLNLKPEQRVKKGIFLAFQNPVSVPGLNIESYLYHIYNNFPRQKEVSLLEFAKLLKKITANLQLDGSLLARSLNDGFSGGEKKRLEVLQLLLLEPQLAILDETDSGLDIDAIKLVAKVIHNLCRRNKTAVMVITHYQRFLKILRPDQVLVMSQGKIVASGDFSLVERIEKFGYRSAVV